MTFSLRTGSICFAILRCERSGSPQRGSLSLARVSISARLAYGYGSPNLTYASGYQSARASSGSQLAPVPQTNDEGVSCAPELRMIHVWQRDVPCGEPIAHLGER